MQDISSLTSIPSYQNYLKPRQLSSKSCLNPLERHPKQLKLKLHEKKYRISIYRDFSATVASKIVEQGGAFCFFTTVAAKIAAAAVVIGLLLQPTAAAVARSSHHFALAKSVPLSVLTHTQSKFQSFLMVFGLKFHIQTLENFIKQGSQVISKISYQIHHFTLKT